MNIKNYHTHVDRYKLKNMPYTLIKGTFHIFYPLTPRNGPEPDGDTIKFQPNNRMLIDNLPKASAAAQFNMAGITSIRFEGIDALETHFSVEGDTFHQKLNLAIEARDVLLAKLGFGEIQYFPDSPFKVSAVENHPIQGYILSNGLDTYGRTIAFVFAGDHPSVDGSSIFVTAETLNSSLNVFMLQQGQVYPAFYLTMPAELRENLKAVAIAARNAAIGVWAEDTANISQTANISNIDILQQLVLWPKLFRRLAAYFQGNFPDLSALDGWLRADPINRDDRLILPNLELGNMHDMIVTNGNDIYLKYQPEDVVIVPDDYQLPAPTPVPQPEVHTGIIRIVAALINPAHVPEINYESVTLLNTTDAEIDLNGLFIADSNGKQALHGTLARGETIRLWLSSAIQLNNTRDTITVLDQEENIIDQVVYESRNLPAQGNTMVF